MDRRRHGHAARGNSIPGFGERVPALRARPVVPQEMAPNVPDGEAIIVRYADDIVSGSNTSGMRSGTSATFGRGWPGSVSASTRTRPASWSLAGSRI